EPFAIDVGEEKLAHERVECLHGFNRTAGHLRAPAVDDNPAAPRVDRRDQPLEPHGLRELRREVDVHAAFGEERRSRDDVRGAKTEHLAGALDTPDAASDTAGGAAGGARD